MSGKQITELDAADALEDGDLMLVRKSANNVDRSISKANLIESIGNPAVSGFIASSSEQCKITLVPSNSALVAKYCEGMKIGFISPINTTEIVKVKIGTLPYKDLQKYSLDETVLLSKGEYVEAIYTNGIFKQTNNLNTHLIWSNEYIAEAEIAPDESTTIYKLTSAVGVKKPNYYPGMSLIFTVPKNSKGIVFVNVDGLGNQKLGESGGSKIAKDIHEARGIMAIYNGSEFIKQKFSTIHVEPVVVVEEPEPPSVVENTLQPHQKHMPNKPIDIWAEDYPGDPDDPANTTSPNALDSKGKPMFAKTITVGNSAMYKTLPEAIAALINDYGDNGGGQRFAIEIDSTYIPNELVTCISSRLEDADLRWITIFGKNNTTLNFNTTIFKFFCRYTPILNCKMSFNHKNHADMTWSMAFYLEYEDTILTFGKNTVINYYSTEFAQFIIWARANCKLEAKYGIYIKTNCGFSCCDTLINKGKFEYICTKPYMGLICTIENTIKLYNTVIHTNITGIDKRITCDMVYKILSFDRSKAHLRNVNCTERTGTIAGLAATNSVVTMEDCNFASNTDGSLNSGIDIVVASKGEIHLHNTTGNLNQAPNKETTNGIIYKD